MNNRLPEISFRHAGDDQFELAKTLPSGEVRTVLLSGGEIVEMARRLPGYVQQILARQHPSVANLPGLENAVVGEVTASKIGLDVYKTMIGMSLTDAQGMTMNYALSSESARDIGARLLAEVDKLVGTTPTKQ